MCVIRLSCSQPKGSLALCPGPRKRRLRPLLAFFGGPSSDCRGLSRPVMPSSVRRPKAPGTDPGLPDSRRISGVVTASLAEPTVGVVRSGSMANIRSPYAVPVSPARHPTPSSLAAVQMEPAGACQSHLPFRSIRDLWAGHFTVPHPVPAEGSLAPYTTGETPTGFLAISRASLGEDLLRQDVDNTPGKETTCSSATYQPAGEVKLTCLT